MISKVNVFVVDNSIDYLIDIHDTSSLFIQMTCRFFCLRYYSNKKNETPHFFDHPKQK